MLMTWDSRKLKYRADNAQELAYVVEYIDNNVVAGKEYWQNDFLAIRKDCRRKAS